MPVLNWTFEVSRSRRHQLSENRGQRVRKPKRPEDLQPTYSLSIPRDLRTPTVNRDHRMPKHSLNADWSARIHSHSHITSPTDPPFRANPSSEGTDLVCRLPLPTLVYNWGLLTQRTCCGLGTVHNTHSAN